MHAPGRLLTAMVTPFTHDGELDGAGVVALTRYLLDNGSDGVVPAGTTGESPTLTHAEKLALFEVVVEAAGGRGAVIAGTGSNDTRATVALSREAEALGVDGLLLIAPYYNKPNQEGLLRHFAAVAEAVSIPIILYNHPFRTGVTIAPATVARLVQEYPHMVGLKDSSGGLEMPCEYLRATAKAPARHTGGGFLLYSGDDPLALPTMALGGQGVISVASHLVGKELARMLDLAVKGDYPEARRIHFRLYPLFKALFATPSPAPTKAALAEAGRPVGGVRLPLVPMTDAERAELVSVLRALDIRSPLEV